MAIRLISTALNPGEQHHAKDSNKCVIGTK